MVVRRFTLRFTFFHADDFYCTIGSSLSIFILKYCSYQVTLQSVEWCAICWYRPQGREVLRPQIEPEDFQGSLIYRSCRCFFSVVKQRPNLTTSNLVLRDARYTRVFVLDV